MTTVWTPIDGETPIDPSSLKRKVKKFVTTRQELSVHEAENIRKPMMKYLSERPTARKASFSYGWCLQLHSEMYGRVSDWAGKVRDRDGQNLGIKWQMIPQQFGSLLEDLASWDGYKIEIYEQAARLHHRAVFIHPFPNGNGRWSRMLANILLRRNGVAHIDWPSPELGEESSIRSEYIAALKIADDGSNYAPLLEMQQKFLASTTRDATHPTRRSHA